MLNHRLTMEDAEVIRVYLTVPTFCSHRVQARTWVHVLQSLYLCTISSLTSHHLLPILMVNYHAPTYKLCGDSYRKHLGDSLAWCLSCKLLVNAIWFLPSFLVMSQVGKGQC
jgi:hypothetical protein